MKRMFTILATGLMAVSQMMAATTVINDFTLYTNKDTTFNVSVPAHSILQYELQCYNESGDYNYINDINMYVSNNGIQRYKQYFEKDSTFVLNVSYHENNTTVKGDSAVFRNFLISTLIDKEIDNISAKQTGSAIHDIIGEENLGKVYSLKIKAGTINSYDFMVIRNKMINLRELDLKGVDVIENDYCYYERYSSKKDTITPYTFHKLTLLKRVILPSSIKHIQNDVFRDCNELESVILPDGLTGLEYGTFSYCRSLRSIDIPATVEFIDSYAFEHNDSLKHVVLPANLKRLGYEAFAYSGLREITIPENVTEIGDGAFSDCRSLKTVSLPKNLEIIGSYAFRYCSSLEEVKIPSSVKNINYDAFNYCDNLKKVYTYTILPTNINQETFSQATYRSAELHIPDQSHDYYYYGTQWSQFLNLVFDSNVEFDNVHVEDDYDIGENGKLDGNPEIDINEGGSINIGNDTDQDSRLVVISSDGGISGSLIIEKGSNLSAAKITFKIKVHPKHWYFITVPIDVPLTGVKAPGNHVIRIYDGALRATGESNCWKNIDKNTTTELKRGEGYIFQCDQSGELTLTVENPEINSADDVESLLEVFTSSSNANASWNLKGNPFPSYYDVNNLGVDQPITVWNGNGYVVIRPGDDEYFLAPFEAFFIQKGSKQPKFDASKQMSYADTQKNKNNKARSAANTDRRLFNLMASSETMSDRARVVINNEAEMGYEIERDAAKFISSSLDIQIYSLGEDGCRYAINERPAAGEIRLGIVAAKAGQYSIQLDNAEGVVLHDTQTGTAHQLSEGAYTFQSEAGTFNGRFTLSGMVDITALDQVEAADAQAAEVIDLSGMTVNGNATGVNIIRQGNGYNKAVIK